MHAKILETGGRSKGCGVVEYEAPEEAAAAILNLHDRELGGRLLCVREDREDHELKAAGHHVDPRGGRDGPPGRRERSRSPRPRAERSGVRADAAPNGVYVGNLAFGTTTEGLEGHARAIAGGGLVSATVSAAANGRSRGWGLLHFDSPAAADAAVAALAETELDGRKLLARLDKGGFVSGRE